MAHTPHVPSPDELPGTASTAATGTSAGGAQDASAVPGTVALGQRLRQLRTDAGLSQTAAADAVGVGITTIWRAEAGQGRLRKRTLQQLLEHYQVPADERDYLLTLHTTESAGWWHAYPIPTWMQAYLALESTAEVLRHYQPAAIPPLLQTPDYTRAAHRATYRQAAAAEVELDVQVTQRRQQHLRRPDGPKLWAVIDEAALLRPLGGPQVHLQQLQALHQAVQQQRISLQIIALNPHGRPMYQPRPDYLPRAGPFTLLRDRDPRRDDVAYLHQLPHDSPVTDPDLVMTYWDIHTWLAISAQPPAATADILADIITQTQTAGPSRG